MSKMSESQRQMILKFLEDLEPTKRYVASWPAWKNQPIPLPRQPDFPSVDLPPDRKR